MATVQVVKYERGEFGRFALAIFLLFEAVMVVGLIAHQTGFWDPFGPPVSVFNARNPMGSMMMSMQQAQMREGFMPGYLFIWFIGSVAFGLLALFTRRRVIVTEERG